MLHRQSFPIGKCLENRNPIFADAKPLMSNIEKKLYDILLKKGRASAKGRTEIATNQLLAYCRMAVLNIELGARRRGMILTLKEYLEASNIPKGFGKI